ncbi:MAG: rRNA maturation RNase YbeY [Chloroflexi bacterium]|nr:rRNA maturation RNase YbeY [Chloroflexota bacterium]
MARTTAGCYHRSTTRSSPDKGNPPSMEQSVQTPVIDLGIDEPFEHRFDQAVVKSAAAAAIRRELKSGPPRVSITVTDDAELQRLNRDFRGLDRPTDVLAFGSADALDGDVRQEDDGFPTPPDQTPTLGDVVISFDQAARQAETAGRPVEHELALLATHGVLHLLGFDHANAADEATMFGKTDEILAEVLGHDAMPVTPVIDALDDAPPAAGPPSRRRT